MDEGDSEPARYRAFISYSHQDGAAGRRLHRRLERYVLPKRLVGRTTPRGAIPRRLGPIFRDREDLPAADSLSDEVRTALAGSACLIVICSPAAKQSPWVAREVELFRALHPDRPVLAALIAGTPADAFPDTLVENTAREPLAADLQPAGDGPRLGFLKLVAGMVGVGLDELVQRDIQRRLRIVTAVTAAALAGMLAMGVLTFLAIEARREAERQRAEAEGMVEFMLTDLRDRLHGVGRLDILDAVNARVMEYYEGEDIDRLPPASLEWWARSKLAKGADLQALGDLEGASGQYQEARRATAALLAADPDNPDYLWTHGQSEYWVGYVALRQRRTDAARTAWESYSDLSEQLVRREPGNPVYLREAGYAQGNLCTLALKPPVAAQTALETCRAGLSHMEAAAAAADDPDGYALDLANRHGWLADAHRANGDNRQARTHRLIQESILTRAMEADPRNMQIRRDWVALQRALVALELVAGRKPQAKRRLIAAAEVLDEMIAHDRRNADWAAQRRQIEADLTAVEEYRGSSQ